MFPIIGRAFGPGGRGNLSRLLLRFRIIFLSMSAKARQHRTKTAVVSKLHVEKKAIEPLAIDGKDRYRYLVSSIRVPAPPTSTSKHTGLDAELESRIAGQVIVNVTDDMQENDESVLENIAQPRLLSCLVHRSDTWAIEGTQ